ncbi:uncharacterized protein [Nicotiana tomentosiformis]|uniref:uncharacterized protein n=1 Tax=Nicotiana tomentosiformis TaxID=4098 RepID=UPI00051BFBC9|nr:uncharacterized protein LOC104096946 [Nicotiana tomentosiformis]
MAPDKQWMELVHDRLDDAYILGVEKFLNYAFTRLEETREIRCPCIKCCNAISGTRELVRSHLIVHGIIQNYTFWYHHGERLGEAQSDSEFVDDNGIEYGDGEDEIHDILRDLFPNFDGDNMNSDGDGFLMEEPNPEAKRFYRVLKEFEQPLCQSSKIFKLSTLVKLLHIKTIGNWNNKSFTMLLKMLKEDLLPDGSNLPDSYYEAKKVIQDLGLSYKKIDACKNDCMLYWKDDKFLESCKVCGMSRWKEDKHSGETKFKSGKKIPYKILRYFPLKPRLQRLFMSSKTSSLMTWHHDKRVDDGIMRHPADSIAWKIFDELHQSFAAEPRNVRLELASDGFQPFRNSKIPYVFGLWYLFLIIYHIGYA